MLTNKDARSADLRATIERTIRTQLMDDDGSTPMSPDDLLVEMGLNSLQFAALLIELESETGVDPFGSGEVSVTDMHSVGDLVEAYSRALYRVSSGA